MTNTSNRTRPATRRVQLRRIVAGGSATCGATARRIAAVVGATVSALVTWALAGPASGVALSVTSGTDVQHVGPGTVAAAALVTGLAAWALLAVLERRIARPARTWTVVALIVLVVSLVGPLGDGADMASRLVLTGMHLAVAAVLIPGLARTARR
ncbi:DUF6069 family protein [Mangrovihabitans endophyticus]|uniref:Uncharacterized protein n=1 Tax=Mangrovihabitans endophyticus TaxID=1751298 RepID=A0A8J3BYX9_9ACTN|nr:DUF6069 family protein [Mangrovihabitans endophyticus]GGK86300.1 hypothetical protein GCM10012284_20680 [Mangrovihabitans endophyticus]